MLSLINEERVSRGLEPLQLEKNLNASAEDHSSWMLQADVFSHRGQGNSTATQRIENSGFDLAGRWATAENIAIRAAQGAAGYRDEVKNLHEGLMNSPGHRANILDPNLKFIGIGIEIGLFTYSDGVERESVIVTQNFATTQGQVDLDNLRGGPEDEVIRGDNSDEFLFGEVGNDTILGGGGSDPLNGNAGNESHDAGLTLITL